MVLRIGPRFMGMPGKYFVTELQSLPTKVFKALYVRLAGETQLTEYVLRSISQWQRRQGHQSQAKLYVQVAVSL